MNNTNDHLRNQWVAAMLNLRGERAEDVAEVEAIRVGTLEGVRKPLGYIGTAWPDDVVYEVRQFGDDAEVQRRWEQAQTVAAALNAASHIPALIAEVERLHWRSPIAWELHPETARVLLQPENRFLGTALATVIEHAGNKVGRDEAVRRGLTNGPEVPGDRKEANGG